MFEPINLTDEALRQTPCLYGKARLQYLKDFQPEEYQAIAARNGLEREKLDTERACRERLDRLIPAMAKAAGLDEDMKRSDLLGWVGGMNTVKAQAEETVYHDIVYK